MRAERLIAKATARGRRMRQSLVHRGAVAGGGMGGGEVGGGEVGGGTAGRSVFLERAEALAATA